MHEPKTLAMRKMEKNFISVMEKNKPRKPYSEFSIWFLIKRLREETNELHEAVLESKFDEAKNEVADCSNILDYIYEQLDYVSRNPPT